MSKVAGVLGQDPAAFSLPADTLQMLENADIQSVELVIRGEGLVPFVPGGGSARPTRPKTWHRPLTYPRGIE